METKTLPGGYITRIHVNQHVIRDNNKTGANNPIFTIKHRGRNIYAREVSTDGTLVYKPESPLSCGARAWLETTNPVTYKV